MNTPTLNTERVSDEPTAVGTCTYCAHHERHHATPLTSGRGLVFRDGITRRHRCTDCAACALADAGKIADGGGS